MNKIFLSAVVAVSLFASGCLVPRPFEFGRDKVKAFPTAKSGEKEVQRQVAQRAAVKAGETLRAAIDTEADARVLAPAAETAVLTEAVSGSLGPPLKPAPEAVTSVELARQLDTAVAKLNLRIDSFADKNDENTGRKIEGSGVFSVGYFTQFLVVGLLLALGFVAIKVFGMFNPAVAVGGKVLSGGAHAVGSLVSKGFSEVVEAGEEFKKKVDDKFSDPATKQKILELFRQAQKEKQSRDVQAAIKGLTN